VEALSEDEMQNISDIVADSDFTTLSNPDKKERRFKAGDMTPVALVQPGVSQWDEIKEKKDIVEMM
jgi:hypothetical protein